MKDSSIAIPAVPGDLVSKDDESLFAFIDTLRLTVRAKVAAEQERGLSLSEIVVQVREMVRLAESEACRRGFPAGTYRAIARQALAWCVEVYRPLAFNPGADHSAPREAHPALPLMATPVHRPSGTLTRGGVET